MSGSFQGSIANSAELRAEKRGAYYALMKNPDTQCSVKYQQAQQQTEEDDLEMHHLLPVRDSNSDCESNEFLKMWFDFRKTSTTFIQLNFLGPVMKLLKAQWIFPKQTDMTRKNFVKGSSYFIMKFF